MLIIDLCDHQALIHLLRSEGVQLGETPTPPIDRRKHVTRKICDEPEWSKYWLYTTMMSYSVFLYSLVNLSTRMYLVHYT